MADKGLSGMTIVSFESRHAKTLSDLIGLHGGQTLSAPALKEVPLESNTQVFAFADELMSGRIEWIILLTGVGTRSLMDVLKTRYPEADILERLRSSLIIPRGPKPIRVLNEWRVPYALTVPEPNTWKELLKALDDYAKEKGPGGSLNGRRVAVQEYGVPNPELVSGLEARGALVMRVPVYRWALPDDTRPLEKGIKSILSGEAQIALFTTAVQASHLFMLATKLHGVEGADQLREALRHLVVASVGPDTSEGIRQQGVRVDLEPESPKMGPLVKLVAEKAKEILNAKRN